MIVLVFIYCIIMGRKVNIVCIGYFGRFVEILYCGDVLGRSDCVIVSSMFFY